MNRRLNSLRSQRKELRIAALALLGWLVLLGLLWLGTQGLEDRWEFGVFLGRFHILVVHLPIGLLFGALVVDLTRFVPAFRGFAPAVVPMLWLSLFGAIGASLLGFSLMRADQFAGAFMTRHLWTGLGVVFLTAVTLFVRMCDANRFVSLGMLGATVVLTGISSHFGGNMVHGETYLTEFAPRPFAPGPAEAPDPEVPRQLALEDRLIYEDVIQPIFDAKCVECHNEGKIKGDLRMDSYEEIAEGGEYGPGFVPGDAEASELYYRVTLESDDIDFMPPEGKGEPMTPGEIVLMAWWINSGASPSMTIREGNPDDEVLGILEEFFVAQGKSDSGREAARTPDSSPEAPGSGPSLLTTEDDHRLPPKS